MYIHTYTTTAEYRAQITPIDAHLRLVKSCLQCPGEVFDNLLTIPPDPRKGLYVLVLVKKCAGLGVVVDCLGICTHVKALFEAFWQLKEKLQLCGGV